MVVTLPKKLESKINQLFPQKEEREAFLVDNLKGLLNMMAVLEGQERDPRSLRVLEKAKTRAKELRGNGVTKEKAYGKLREQVKKLEI